MESLSLGMIALLPPVVLMVVIYVIDRRDKEPLKLVLLTVVLGVASTVLAIILEVLAEVPLELLGDSGLLYLIAENFLGVALIEELCKFLATKKAWKSPDCNFTFDAIVYSSAATLGFAAAENLLYVWDGGMSVGIGRAIFSIPGHLSFGIFMGLFLGLAKEAEMKGDAGKRKSNMLKAILVPTLIHGTYDFLLSVDDDLFMLAFYLFVLVIDIVTIVVVIKAAKSDREVIAGAEQRALYEPTFGKSKDLGGLTIERPADSVESPDTVSTNSLYANLLFCPVCGNRLRESAADPMPNFCTGCGTRYGQ